MIIDSHSHLQFPAFDKDREEVIKRALDSDIWLVNVGADKESSQKAVELTDRYKEGIFAAVGQHPHEADAGFKYDFYKKLAQNPKVAAIGECGLDYYRIKNHELRIMDIQKEIFVKHIELAKEVGKPLMIHCRDAPKQSKLATGRAFSDLIEILKPKTQNLKPNIIHFFTGALADAKQLLEMGFYFTFGGLITYNRDFDEIIKFIPSEKILLETDAPYVSPIPYRGKRNEPLYIIETAKKMAEIKGVSFEKVCEQTSENARKILGI